MVGVKGNRRVHYTQTALKAALLKLLENHPLELITITQLCREADINRGTFYQHYKSIDDLFHTLEDEMVFEIQQAILAEDPKNFDHWLPILIKVLANYRTLAIRLIRNGENGQLLMMIFSTLHDMAISGLQQTMLENDSRRLEYFLDFFTMGTAGILAKWLEEDSDMSPEEMTAILLKIYNRI